MPGTCVNSFSTWPRRTPVGAIGESSANRQLLEEDAPKVFHLVGVERLARCGEVAHHLSCVTETGDDAGTKHHPQRYARSPGYLDWAAQPASFRRFRGAPTLPLLLGDTIPSPSYDALCETDAISPQSVCLESISALFQYSLAVSAWKGLQGSRWALWINPSSGNLHPPEGHLVAGAVELLPKRHERWDATRRQLTELLAADPEDIRACDGIGFVCHRLGDTDRVLHFWPKSLRENPNVPAIIQALAQVYRDSGKKGC